MAIDAVTVSLLSSVLKSPSIRDLFTTIASSRIAAAKSLRAGNMNGDLDPGLDALQKADLIDVAEDREKYFVTAKGLRVARDLERLPAGS